MPRIIREVGLRVRSSHFFSKISEIILTKTVSRHAEVQISGVLARTQPFLSRSVEKRGDQSQFKCREMVNHYAIRSITVMIMVIVDRLDSIV